MIKILDLIKDNPLFTPSARHFVIIRRPSSAICTIILKAKIEPFAFKMLMLNFSALVNQMLPIAGLTCPFEIIIYFVEPDKYFSFVPA